MLLGVVYSFLSNRPQLLERRQNDPPWIAPRTCSTRFYSFSFLLQRIRGLRGFGFAFESDFGIHLTIFLRRELCHVQ